VRQFRNARDKIFLPQLLFAPLTSIIVVLANDLDAAHVIATLAALPGLLVVDIEAELLRLPVCTFGAIHHTGFGKFELYFRWHGVRRKPPCNAPEVFLSGVAL
jgi:hypothetical protein